MYQSFPLIAVLSSYSACSYVNSLGGGGLYLCLLICLGNVFSCPQFMVVSVHTANVMCINTINCAMHAGM